jgi:hypothetical protein
MQIRFPAWVEVENCGTPKSRNDTAGDYATGSEPDTISECKTLHSFGKESAASGFQY